MPPHEQVPSISIRQGIQWGNELQHLIPKSEPTCTLVLTSPAGRFVDVRLVRPRLLSTAAPNPPFETLLREVSGPEYHDPVLEWAFSGTSSRRVTRKAVSSDGEGELARAQWTHTVDSNHVDATKVDDQGDCRAYYDPDKAVMMEEELGEMLNPATQIMQVYRETWATPEPDYLSNSPTQRVCIVFELLDTRAESQGLLVRVGAWVQGILRRGEHVSIIRQHLQLIENSEVVDQEIRMGPHVQEFPFPSSLQESTKGAWDLVEKTTW